MHVLRSVVECPRRTDRQFLPALPGVLRTKLRIFSSPEDGAGSWSPRKKWTTVSRKSEKERGKKTVGSERMPWLIVVRCLMPKRYEDTI